MSVHTPWTRGFWAFSPFLNHIRKFVGYFIFVDSFLFFFSTFFSGAVFFFSKLAFFSEVFSFFSALAFFSEAFSSFLFLEGSLESLPGTSRTRKSVSPSIKWSYLRKNLLLPAGTMMSCNRSQSSKIWRLNLSGVPAKVIFFSLSHSAKAYALIAFTLAGT